MFYTPEDSETGSFGLAFCSSSGLVFCALSGLVFCAPGDGGTGSPGLVFLLVVERIRYYMRVLSV